MIRYPEIATALRDKLGRFCNQEGHVYLRSYPKVHLVDGYGNITIISIRVKNGMNLTLVVYPDDDGKQYITDGGTIFKGVFKGKYSAKQLATLFNSEDPPDKILPLDNQEGLRCQVNSIHDLLDEIGIFYQILNQIIDESNRLESED